MRTLNTSSYAHAGVVQHPVPPVSRLVPEIGPSGCPLCGGWMWFVERAGGVGDAVAGSAGRPPASMPDSRELSYRCSRCQISCSYWMAEDGTRVVLERQ